MLVRRSTSASANRCADIASARTKLREQRERSNEVAVFRSSVSEMLFQKEIYDLPTMDRLRAPCRRREKLRRDPAERLPRRWPSHVPHLSANKLAAHSPTSSGRNLKACILTKSVPARFPTSIARSIYASLKAFRSEIVRRPVWSACTSHRWAAAQCSSRHDREQNRRSDPGPLPLGNVASHQSQTLCPVSAALSIPVMAHLTRCALHHIPAAQACVRRNRGSRRPR